MIIGILVWLVVFFLIGRSFLSLCGIISRTRRGGGGAGRFFWVSHNKFRECRGAIVESAFSGTDSGLWRCYEIVWASISDDSWRFCLSAGNRLLLISFTLELFLGKKIPDYFGGNLGGNNTDCWELEQWFDWHGLGCLLLSAIRHDFYQLCSKLKREWGQISLSEGFQRAIGMGQCAIDLLDPLNINWFKGINEFTQKNIHSTLNKIQLNYGTLATNKNLK